MFDIFRLNRTVSNIIYDNNIQLIGKKFMSNVSWYAFHFQFSFDIGHGWKPRGAWRPIWALTSILLTWTITRMVSWINLTKIGGSKKHTHFLWREMLFNRGIQEIFFPLFLKLFFCFYHNSSIYILILKMIEVIDDFNMFWCEAHKFVASPPKETSCAISQLIHVVASPNFCALLRSWSEMMRFTLPSWKIITTKARSWEMFLSPLQQDYRISCSKPWFFCERHASIWGEISLEEFQDFVGRMGGVWISVWKSRWIKDKTKIIK